MNTPTPKPTRWRKVRLCLVGLAAIATLIGLFYTEENWRGHRAWETCKKSLEAQGIDFKWADYIPAPVPESQNVFAVPEMQEWFTGRGATELSEKMVYRASVSTNPVTMAANNRDARLVVADLKILLPANFGDVSNVLRWGDSNAGLQAAKLIKQALGPVALHPGSTNLLFTARALKEIRPAQILMECQTAPSAEELLKFLPRVSAITDTTDDEQLQLEPEAGGYKVTMTAPDSAAEFLKWNKQFEPEFALIREALRRPMVRMKGNYAKPELVAIPNFVTARIFVQALAAMTECHLLQGNPDAALDDLTRMHEICHIFTNRPITLMGAMMNIAVRGLYVDTVAHGLHWQAWREPQLAALEEQLKTIDLIEPLEESLHEEPVSACETLRSLPLAGLLEFYPDSTRTNAWSVLKESLKERWNGPSIPRGWIYQNMAVTGRRAGLVDTWLDPANRAVFPRKVETDQTALSSLSHNSPYSFIAVGFIPNSVKACQRAALSQTKAHHAVLACALERYHLANGAYPENLAALVPQYLGKIPADVIGGQAPHYRRAGDGTYILYSVGWSARDSGGGPSKSIAEGDWAWPEANLL